MAGHVTIKDIAREAGVSPSLVSFVFNGKNRVGESTRQHVLEVAQRLGYSIQPAARKEWPSARLVGAIVPSAQESCPWLDLLSRCAYRRGYTLLTASAHNDPVHFAHLVRAFSEVQGLVAIPIRGEEEDCLEALRTSQLKYVIPDTENPDQTIQALIDQL